MLLLPLLDGRRLFEDAQHSIFRSVLESTYIRSLLAVKRCIGLPLHLLFTFYCLEGAKEEASGNSCGSRGGTRSFTRRDIVGRKRWIIVDTCHVSIEEEDSDVGKYISS